MTSTPGWASHCPLRPEKGCPAGDLPLCEGCLGFVSPGSFSELTQGACELGTQLHPRVLGKVSDPLGGWGNVKTNEQEG